MAARGVIVRRLNAIENLGSMDVFCTDKTGTLTEGVVQLDAALDAQGRPSAAVLHAAHLNAHFQTGLDNPLDAAIDAYAKQNGASVAEHKVDEIPYDFVRKRLSVVVSEPSGSRTMITKGALARILDVCDRVCWDGVEAPLDADKRASIDRRYGDWGEQGYRVLGIATKVVDGRDGPYSRSDETGLVFAGFLLFFDPPKHGVQEVIADLGARGVELKIITGDSRKVARHVADAVGLPVAGLLTGGELDDLRDEALWHLAERTTIFAEVDPNQKERIILALRKTGHVVGYMGDGINDAPALHAADVGLSVDNAVDVAKAAADFVLLQADLGILREGIDEGRRTFANTLKYILTTISANFGNMFSMAGASLMLPFLPLLSSQILLNNFLSDIPAATIASDNVDAGMGRQAAALEREIHPRLHGAVRAREFAVRFSDVRDAAVRVQRGCRDVSHRLVHRIAVDRTRDCAGRADAPSVLPQSPEQGAAREHGCVRADHADPAVPADECAVRIRAAAAVADSDAARTDGVVRRRRGGRETLLLPALGERRDVTGMARRAHPPRRRPTSQGSSCGGSVRARVANGASTTRSASRSGAVDHSTVSHPHA